MGFRSGPVLTHKRLGFLWGFPFWESFAVWGLLISRSLDILVYVSASVDSPSEAVHRVLHMMPEVLRLLSSKEFRIIPRHLRKEKCGSAATHSVHTHVGKISLTSWLARLGSLFSCRAACGFQQACACVLGTKCKVMI